MTDFSTERFYVGDWRVDPQRNRIQTDDLTRQIEPKVMDVLVCLARRAEEVVSKNEIMNEVWADRVVVDKVVTRAISELRKAFEDDARNPSVIETIPKRGYRLIAPVTPRPPLGGAVGDGKPESTVVSAHLSSSRKPNPREANSSWKRRWIGAGVAVLAALLTGVGWWLANESPPSSPSFTHAQPLTSLPGHERDPAYSPDGKMVAYIWGPQGCGCSDLYVKQPGMDDSLRLTHTQARVVHPTWSPDGQRLAFLQYAADGTPTVYTVPALGGTKRPLVSPPENTLPGFDWSPEGRTLAVAVRPTSSHPGGLRLIDTKTGNQRTLTTPSGDARADVEPMFSPDGQHVLFRRLRTARTEDLYLVSRDGGSPRRLTSDNRDLIGHDWMPDGRRVIFSSDRGGRYNLWSISLQGGDPRPVTPGGWNFKDPSVAQKGNGIVYERWLYDTNIERRSLSGEAASSTTPSTPVIASSLWDQQPDLSPDGRRIAFVSNRSGSYEVWTSTADGTDAVRRTSFEDSYVGSPRWSPDGSSIAFETRRGGHADVYVVEDDGGALHRITHTPTADDVAPSWSPDGRWIYFASNRSGTWQVWKTARDGGDPVQVTEDGGFRPLVGPNGDALYFTKNGTPGLWKKPFGGGPAIRLTDALQPYDWGNWTVTEEDLYYVQRSRRATTVHRLSLDTGTDVEVATLDGRLVWNQPGLTMGPDRQSILYAHVHRSESDLVLLEPQREAQSATLLP